MPSSATALASSFTPNGFATNPLAYYRSKLFTANTTPNPLIAAAQPIFSLLERLAISTELPPIANLRVSLEHELFAFHSRLLSQNYAAALTSLAQYLLSATIDELLGKSYLRISNNAPTFQAFTPCTEDNIGPEQRVFDIIGFLKEAPHQYLDLIELAYYCLIAGFEGHHFSKPNGRAALDNLIEELFQLINVYRVPKTYLLFFDKAQNAPYKKSYKLALFASSIAVTIILTLYSISHYVIEHQAKTLLAQHAFLQHMDNNG